MNTTEINLIFFFGFGVISLIFFSKTSLLFLNQWVFNIYRLFFNCGALVPIKDVYSVHPIHKRVNSLSNFEAVGHLQKYCYSSRLLIRPVNTCNEVKTKKLYLKMQVEKLVVTKRCISWYLCE